MFNLLDFRFVIYQKRCVMMCRTKYGNCRKNMVTGDSLKAASRWEVTKNMRSKAKYLNFEDFYFFSRFLVLAQNVSDTIIFRNLEKLLEKHFLEKKSKNIEIPKYNDNSKASSLSNAFVSVFFASSAFSTKIFLIDIAKNEIFTVYSKKLIEI